MFCEGFVPSLLVLRKLRPVCRQTVNWTEKTRAWPEMAESALTDDAGATHKSESNEQLVVATVLLVMSRLN